MYCHFYQLTGKCKRGDKCNFKHKNPVTYACLNQYFTCALCKKDENKDENKVKRENMKKEYKQGVEEKIKAEKFKAEEDVNAYEMPSEQQEKLLEIKKKEDAVYQGIAANKVKLLDKRVRDAHQDLQLFKPLEKIFRSKLSLDLMFIMDCTGSMSSWIKAVKTELYNIIDNVLEEHEGARINMSVVAYRDHSDGNKRLEVLPFTEMKDVVLSFVSELAAMGGGDAPEDICGGFQEALKLNWTATAKYAVLIADAPCHGKRYHDLADSYPEGDPLGLDPEKQILEFAKRGINLYGIKIAANTDKMYKIFNDVYQDIAKKPIQIADLSKNIKAFGFFIASTVTATLSGSVVNSDVSMIKKALKYLRELKNNNKLVEEQMLSELIKFSEIPEMVHEISDKKGEVIEFASKFKAIPSWPNLQDSTVHECVQMTYFIVKDKGVPINWRKPLVQNSQISSSVRICNLPFSEGAMRYAFYAYDTLLNQKLVVKLNKRTDYNTIAHMSKDLELVYICQHLVNTFNDSIVELVPDTRLLLTFVHTFLIELKKNKQMYYAENYIDGAYEKFSNNAGWETNKVSESSLISHAFSHYSYQATEGYLMVVDLQGASGILTDPQIHCLDTDRFGAGNLGYEGILKFFFNHTCNHYCKELGLVNPKNTECLPENFSFSQPRIKPENLKKAVFTICDLCKGAYKSTAGFVFQKRLEDQLKYCKPCDDKRKQTMKKGNCEWCNTSFSSSEYWFQMMRTDFPTLCGECRRKRRENMRKDLEEKEKVQMIVEEKEKEVQKVQKVEKIEEIETEGKVLMKVQVEKQ